MALPPQLSMNQVLGAKEYVEREAQSDLFTLLYDEQPNLFSAVIGVLATVALDAISPYEKNPDRHRAASRFPDLILRGASRNPVPPSASLECKASKRPWNLDAHFNHEGWYIVWRYLVDPTKRLGKRVLVWRIDCAYLVPEHWTYVGSQARQGQGGRTHTFTVKNPRMVFGEAVFSDPRIRIVRNKPVFNGS